MSSTIATLRWVDVLDILIVSGLLWAAIVWLRQARARVALGGVAVIGALFWLAHGFDLRLTTRLLQGFVALSALVVVVVFQDDLRRFFEGITVWFAQRVTPRPTADLVEELCDLCFSFAERRIGALLVLPGREPLDRLLDGGHYLDGRVSEPLLRSLADPRTPGHDGAIVIRGGKVARFGVHLPLSTEWDEIGGGGTRHAAGLGLAERSDAMSVIVSEERGEVSVAWRGRLERIADARSLRETIEQFLQRTARRRRDKRWPARVAELRRHWREGLVASAVATGLWVHVVPGAVLERSSKAIPVVIENLPEGYRVAEIDPPRVDVVFEGRKRDLVMAREDRLQVRLDGEVAGPGRATLPIGEELVEHPPELEIVAIEPAQVRLAIETR